MGEANSRKVLVIDDEDAVRKILSLKLERSGYECTGLADGLRAIHALQGERFDAIIADINMPYMRGTELLKWVKIADPDLPVIIISGLEDLDVVRRTMKDGAFDYLVKPLDLAVLENAIRRAIEHGGKAREAREHQRNLQRLVEHRTEELQRVLGEIEHTYDATILALGSALETRDTETQTHGLRVARYAVVLAKRLGISDSRELTNIERGAYLHDIGKIGVPDQILRKNGPLTPAERAIMMRHPDIGMRLVAGIGFLKGASPIVYCHHERTDGEGYPRRLRGEEIPIEARIFSVADALDAMISERPYRAPLPLATARRGIAGEGGKQFDPVVTQTLASVPDDEILGIARLVDGQAVPVLSHA